LWIQYTGRDCYFLFPIRYSCLFVAFVSIWLADPIELITYIGDFVYDDDIWVGISSRVISLFLMRGGSLDRIEQAGETRVASQTCSKVVAEYAGRRFSVDAQGGAESSRPELRDRPRRRRARWLTDRDGPVLLAVSLAAAPSSSALGLPLPAPPHDVATAARPRATSSTTSRKGKSTRRPRHVPVYSVPACADPFSPSTHYTWEGQTKPQDSTGAISARHLIMQGAN